MKKCPDIYDQIEGRKKLVWSARLAKEYMLLSMGEWLMEPEPKEICEEYELDTKILEHIANFIWKPMR